MKLALKDVYSDIIDFEYNMYAQPNEWGCSKCGTPVDGPVHVVSEEDDEEGEAWRIFCPKCWKKAEESPFTITDLYEMYKPATYLGEDEYMEEDQVESAITASTNSEIYRQIYDDVIGDRVRFNTTLKRIQGLANAVVQYGYDGITEMKDAVFCALELLEEMTGQWYDPTQDEYDSLVHGEYTPY